MSKRKFICSATMEFFAKNLGDAKEKQFQLTETEWVNVEIASSKPQIYQNMEWTIEQQLLESSLHKAGG